VLVQCEITGLDAFRSNPITAKQPLINVTEGFWYACSEVEIITLVVDEAVEQKTVVKFSTRKPGFDPRPDHVRSLANKAATNRVFPRIMFSVASIIVPILLSHYHLHVTHSRGTNGRRLGTFQTAKLLGKSESMICKTAFI
jgi:hypothetical protein